MSLSDAHLLCSMKQVDPKNLSEPAGAILHQLIKFPLLLHPYSHSRCEVLIHKLVTQDISKGKSRIPSSQVT